MSEDRVSMIGQAFETGAGFEAGDVSGGLRLGRFEAQYEELFAEVIEDGIITAEERARLEKAADNMGLDKARLARLEAAMQKAWEARHQVKIVVQAVAPTIGYADDDDVGRASLAPMAPAPVALGQPVDVNLAAMQKRIAFLEGRVKQLESELEEARNNVSVEVDIGAVAAPVAEDDPADLQRRIRQDPTDPEPMRALFRLARAHGDLDKEWCIASALVAIGAANDEERTLHQKHRSGTLPKFASAVSADAWRKLLFHPDEELLTGDIFAVVTSAVLLGRVSALRRDKLLPKLDPQRKQDPATSTLSSVRALSWSAAILGLRPPPIFIDPELPIGVEMVPGIPPSVRVGQRLLSGRTPLEIAFECGRLLACFREEHFVRWLFPGIPDLEDLFLAALTIGSPTLPIPPAAKARVAPIAAAIEPVLEPPMLDRLRGCFLRFVEEGGRTNLQRWAHGVDKTASRAGLLLCNDLATAGAILAKEEKGEHGGALGERMLDLVTFVTSDRYFALRRQLGVAITQG